MLNKQKAYANFKENNRAGSNTLSNAKKALAQKMTIGNVVYVPSGKSDVNDSIRINREPRGPVRTEQVRIIQKKKRDAFTGSWVPS